MKRANKVEYVTGTGQKMWNIHSADKCAGEFCVIHNPSDHPMKEFPTHWRSDRSLMERICPHGIGHPDPDGLTYSLSIDHSAGIHGCDGCCSGNGPYSSKYFEGVGKVEDFEPEEIREKENPDFWDMLFGLSCPAKQEHQLAEFFKTKKDDDWIDKNAQPNGIGPVCKYCHNLIDWSPTDHALDCDRFGDNNGMGN